LWAVTARCSSKRCRELRRFRLRKVERELAHKQAAINALTGMQLAGKYLCSDGTNVTIAAIQASDVPTLNQNTTDNAARATLATSATNIAEDNWIDSISVG
jgi:hypothetical protein